MQINVAIDGSIKQFAAGIEKEVSAALRGGIADTVDGLTAEYRKQVEGAGLGRRLANTWQGKVYPRDKKPSLSPAGLVYSKAPVVVRAFDEGSLIRSKDGWWLAIPTPEAARFRGGSSRRQRITPALFEQATGQRLRFVYRPHAVSLLVLDNQRARTGRYRGQFAAASASAVRSGRGLATVVMFFLVRQVKLPKKLDIARPYQAWSARAPALIEKHLYS
jgi:hypothetical protein